MEKDVPIIYVAGVGSLICLVVLFGFYNIKDTQDLKEKKAVIERRHKNNRTDLTYTVAYFHGVRDAEKHTHIDGTNTFLDGKAILDAYNTRMELIYKTREETVSNGEIPK